MRVDTGVEEGDAITPFYDPMIAKLIVHASDRAGALARMRDALARYRIVGVANNVEFLGRLVATPSFANADLDTALIEREQRSALPDRDVPPDDVWLLAALAEVERDAVAARRAAASAAAMRRRRGACSTAGASTAARCAGSAFAAARRCARSTSPRCPTARGSLLLDGMHHPGAPCRTPTARWRATLGGRRFATAVVAQGERRHVFVARPFATR